MGNEFGIEKLEVNNKSIRSFTDLNVYQRVLEATKITLIKLIPRLPTYEKFDLGDQMRRCCKAIPALIAEGYAKKHQLRAFKKYLDDALGECNEMNPHLVICRDVYGIDDKLCNYLIDTYEIAGKQLYNLKRNWMVFGRQGMQSNIPHHNS